MQSLGAANAIDEPWNPAPAPITTQQPSTSTMPLDDDLSDESGPLPPGWVKEWDSDKNRYYYAHPTTMRAVWTRKECFE